MPRQRRTKYKIDDIITAIEQSRGMIYVAARSLGCAASTIYGYMRRYPQVQAAVDHQRGMLIDVAELALWRAVQDGEPWAVALVLKTLGRHRGYIERQEIAGPDSGPIRLTFDVSGIVGDDDNPDSDRSE